MEYKFFNGDLSDRDVWLWTPLEVERFERAEPCKGSPYVFESVYLLIDRERFIDLVRD